MRAFLRKYFTLILLVLVIVLAGLSVFLYRKSAGANTPVGQAAEVQKIITRVAKLAEVPTDETPTLATVSDPDALKNQPFFAAAKKGDKVLIYANAKKAYLYDPTANKIVNIAPLNTGDNGATTPTTSTTQTKK